MGVHHFPLGLGVSWGVNVQSRAPHTHKRDVAASLSWVQLAATHDGGSCRSINSSNLFPWLRSLPHVVHERRTADGKRRLALQVAFLQPHILSCCLGMHLSGAVAIIVRS